MAIIKTIFKMIFATYKLAVILDLAISTPIMNDFILSLKIINALLPLNHVLYIIYSVRFKNNLIKIQVILNFGNEINSSIFEMFEKILANFQSANKLDRT